MKRNAKVDSNQKQIVAALRGVGCYVLHLHQIKNAFDILVFYKGNVFCVEIKDGTKFASQQKLTKGEISCKESMESVGVKYHIVTSVQDAIKLIESSNT